MTDRRPHWSDDLIDAVIRAESDAHDYEYRAMAAIAAVEAWHRDRWTGVCESPEEVVRELKQAQAAIQRVREACDHERCSGEYGRDAEVVAAVPVHVVLRALDGADE